ncbi:MAG: phosphate transport protein PstB [Pseudomonadota bacterium]|jgi:phosphate transport system ATP-binding protein
MASSPISAAHEPALPAVKLEVLELCAWFREKRVLNGIHLGIAGHRVTAVIGPSGCGKSTFIRCLNRMHELSPEARVTGQVRLDASDVYAPGVDPALLRRRVGMVFQKPNPFPSMSVRENVLSGLRLTGLLPGAGAAQEILERALGQAALWEEVKDRLSDPGLALSSGQQQRLCIARALAVSPDVLLMDEPCSTLDPVASARIEDLIHSLKESYTIVVVTHSMQQAARISDHTAFFLAGNLIEFDTTDRIFTSPKDSRTEDYITGKFG